MIKYLLTKNCPRKCTYCISRNIHQEESYDLAKVNTIYSELAKTDDSIMFTGGEPTIAELFIEKIFLASLKFKHLYLTTQNIKIFDNKWVKLFSAITFSLHDIHEWKKINIFEFTYKYQIPVYASILDNNFYQDLPEQLINNGWAGLTINEEQREGHRFNDSIVQEFPNFSIKINRKTQCRNDTMIMPDLTIINDFTPYL